MTDEFNCMGCHNDFPIRAALPEAELCLSCAQVLRNIVDAPLLTTGPTGCHIPAEADGTLRGVPASLRGGIPIRPSRAMCASDLFEVADLIERQAVESSEEIYNELDACIFHSYSSDEGGRISAEVSCYQTFLMLRTARLLRDVASVYVQTGREWYSTRCQIEVPS